MPMSPDTHTVTLHARLKGGRPWEPRESECWSAEWYADIQTLIAEGDLEAACTSCAPHLTALFLCSEISALESTEEVPGSTVKVSQPWLEEQPGGPPLLLFRWWYAKFDLKVSSATIRAWAADDGQGALLFNLDEFEAWLEANNVWGLQDGVRFCFEDVNYELDGMGELSCEVDEASVNVALETMFP